MPESRDESSLPALAKVTHLPLRGREGVALGVEPIARPTEPDVVNDELARRARRLARNDWRSTPPPAA